MKSNRPRQRQHAVPPRDARNRSLTVLLGWLPQSWLYWHRAQRRFNCFSIDVLLAWFTRPQGHKVFIWAPTKAGTQIFLFPSLRPRFPFQPPTLESEDFSLFFADKFTSARRNLLRRGPLCEKFPSLFSFMENHKNNTIIYICFKPASSRMDGGMCRSESSGIFGRAINSLPHGTGCEEFSCFVFDGEMFFCVSFVHTSLSRISSRHPRWWGKSFCFF